MDNKSKNIIYTVKRNSETGELEAIAETGQVIKHSEFANGAELKEGQRLVIKNNSVG